MKYKKIILWYAFATAVGAVAIALSYWQLQQVTQQFSQIIMVFL